MRLSRHREIVKRSVKVESTRKYTEVVTAVLQKESQYREEIAGYR